METYKDHITMSPDLNAERLETLRQLFPDWFTQEGHLDVNEVKKAVNPDSVDETERYEFRWFGKSKAKRNAFTPTRATLHYDEARSVNADKTENIIIEGENLEVLKILTARVKCIYIDPPYNTGEDFLYNDDFSENKQAYWERTEQSEDGVVLDTNSDASGRFHSNWLDNMYSRLLVARNLLKPTGVIFISMDDHEIHHLRKICDEIFGEENFFLEMQPSNEEEQVFVNTEIQKISAAMGIPVIITTDAHYLKKEDRKIHKAYLNSKDGDREVDSFYASTYVMTAEEIHEYMDDTVGASSVSEYLSNTNLIADMCEDYSLEKPIVVPYIPLNDYEYLIKDRNYNISEYYSNIPSLKLFAESPYISDNHLAFRIVDAINSSKFYTQDGKTKDRLDRIEVELNTLWTSSEKQDIRWSAYLLQESDYVKIFWEDSLVGPGRGSGVSFYLNYLLDICQIDPTREKAPMRYWRFINPERASILD